MLIYYLLIVLFIVFEIKFNDLKSFSENENDIFVFINKMDEDVDESIFFIRHDRLAFILTRNQAIKFIIDNIYCEDNEFVCVGHMFDGSMIKFSVHENIINLSVSKSNNKSLVEA